MQCEVKMQRVPDGQLLGATRQDKRDVQMRLDKLRQWRFMSRRTRQGLLQLPGDVPYVHEQTGLEVVYDDVCGQRAIECWMQARAQKQEVKEKAGNKPGREAVRYGRSTR
jgi:hypothetical protein